MHNDAANNENVSQAAFRTWRYLVPTNTSVTTHLGFKLPQFFQQALDLINGDPGTRQEVISKLASEGGLQRIHELISQDMKSLPEPRQREVFSTQILPFFCSISHPSVLASAVLEQSVGTIFNFLFGIHGQRAIKLFDAIVSLLFSPIPDHGSSSLVGERQMTAVTAVLSKIVDVNGTAQVIEPFHPIVEALSHILEKPFASGQDMSMYQAKKHLRRVQQRLSLGRTMPHSQLATNADLFKPTFTVDRDPPGTLSNQGRRHDNDSQNICDIRIMPTSQEFQSSRMEYLPLNDPDQLHLPGLHGLLDRQFRLVREDTIGQLRDAVRHEFEHLRTEGPATQLLKQHRARVYTYYGVAVTDFAVDRWKGLEFAVGFEQPAIVRNLSPKERREWWEASKRLKGDSLVCLLDSESSVVFCSVSQQREARAPTHKKMGETLQSKLPLSESWNLYGDSDTAYVVLHLVNLDLSNVSQLFDWYLSGFKTGRRALVEFPGVLLPSFQPTLLALQGMIKTADLPFAELIAPTTASSPDLIELPAPAYTTKEGFRFDLRSVMSSGETSSLDESQAGALVDALSRGLALIQGPPGTGKSYTGVALIKVLLDSKAEADLGPIVCVCYTNHALDQLLEYLVDHQVTQIVRIGSRSKSEKLQSLNLRLVVQQMEPTKMEKHRRWELNNSLNDEEEEIRGLVARLTDVASWGTIKEHLRVHWPRQHNQLFGEEDEDGFKIVHHHPERIIEDWLRRCSKYSTLRRPRPLSQLQYSQLESMSASESRTLHQSWIFEVKNDLQQNLLIAYSSYEHRKTSLNQLQNELSLRCLQHANAKVLVCEEAGEVLEAHILTALLPSVEHAILIGDHLQLRPKIQNYDLSQESLRGAKYSLDTSLFERLVEPKLTNVKRLPFSTLSVQRRMHPSIAALVKDTLYLKLTDHPSVQTYLVVPGVSKRLFWLDHSEPETGLDPQQMTTISYTNDFELKMTAALVSHLVRQGVYKISDIAVLTPYLGQLRKLKKRLVGSFEIVINDLDLEELEREGEQVPQNSPTTPVSKTTLLQTLKVATVDNFQGNEAEVVVISLVRSNDQNRTGFLKTSNRINVLLSRAKHGMYILGNTKTYSTVPMWAKVISILEQGGHVGPSVCGENCPSAEMCQTCGSDRVKSMQVDFISFDVYKDIDLNEDPCIFPACGHTMTVSNMDGIMEMHDFYEFSPDGHITALKSSSEPFSAAAMKSCPNCRGSLRDIARYGRIVRRALLDESTKKFIVWANKEYVTLGRLLATEQDKLADSIEGAVVPSSPVPGSDISITGIRDQQIKLIRKLKYHGGYKVILGLRQAIRQYCAKAHQEEQTFQRVRSMVEAARQRLPTTGDFEFDSSVLQTRVVNHPSNPDEFRIYAGRDGFY
ncbi:hypothetical protein B0A49_00387 [Cryomyces minteri]|uniref:NFX1-type zinc finger-containing protein 1 n=1 Tax=Cryomyces minteri TaxID=331657 RepID=A0A4U0XYU7_9PEZI|nr:hypothetical protein B0A49_02567 [Cryomyces minteri]TKA81901.1 hypothetical protein B0A49_00387 [Cryomyces minteri]